MLQVFRSTKKCCKCLIPSQMGRFSHSAIHVTTVSFHSRFYNCLIPSHTLQRLIPRQTLELSHSPQMLLNSKQDKRYNCLTLPQMLQLPHFKTNITIVPCHHKRYSGFIRRQTLQLFHSITNVKTLSFKDTCYSCFIPPQISQLSHSKTNVAIVSFEENVTIVSFQDQYY